MENQRSTPSKSFKKKITKKVMGWKEKFISKASREILIKIVAQAIPTYSMCLFKIPKAICDKINSISSNYWWGQTKDEKKIHWINWQKLCKKKKMEEWVLETFHLSTWQCSLSRRGGSFTILIHSFIGCIRHGNFQIVAS